MGKYADELRDLDALFRQAPEPDAPIPDGIYTGQLIIAEIVRGKTDPSQLFLRVELGILGGSQDGQVASLLQPLTVTEPKRVLFLKRLLRTLGYDEPGLSALEDWLPSIIGRTYEVQVKTNGQYTNVYINRRVLHPDGDGSTVDLPDPLPF